MWKDEGADDRDGRRDKRDDYDRRDKHRNRRDSKFRERNWGLRMFGLRFEQF